MDKKWKVINVSGRYAAVDIPTDHKVYFKAHSKEHALMWIEQQEFDAERRSKLVWTILGAFAFVSMFIGALMISEAL